MLFGRCFEGIRATVLKGRAISQYYDMPHHRYSCDLDVFIGKGWERACELLESGEPTYFEGTTLVCPPLMFSVMLYVEHAQGDFLHVKLLLKHVVDWVVLRRQTVDWEAFGTKCKEFRFDRFVALIEALADVVEGKREYEALPDAYKEAFDEMLQMQEASEGQRTWFQRRVHLFFDILRNGKKFRRYGYTSMPSYLFHSVWTHFFDREVRGI